MASLVSAAGAGSSEPGSPAMLAETARQCAPFGDRLTTRAFDLGSEDWRQLPVKPHAVVSSLAVHHLDGAGIVDEGPVHESLRVRHEE